MRTAALRALLRRLNAPALDLLLRNNAGWAPAGSDDLGRGGAGGAGQQHLLTPERVVCTGGGWWDTARPGAGRAWRAVEPQLTESGRTRRREVQLTRSRGPLQCHLPCGALCLPDREVGSCPQTRSEPGARP